VLAGKKYLLFFGRFQLHKGVHILARALPQFFDRYPDAHVAVVGQDMSSTLAPSMADYIRANCGRYTDQLLILDKLPHKKLYPVIAGARLVVLPSLIENFPNACLEAMGLGKVVVGTLGTSFDELITDGETGFLVPANDSQALAEKLNSAWSNPALERIGQAARERVSELSPEKTVVALLAFYEEVLSRHDNL
jgi:glycosyltransferase involved in cell wall biosynthesis